MLLVLLIAALSLISTTSTSVRFGPALNADPGAGEPFASPESEFDNQAGVECPNPPCRQLKRDLEARRDHNIELTKKEKDTTNGHNFSDDQMEYPPNINLILGGKDCKICNQILLGEGLNPMDLHKMRELIPAWEARTNKWIEAKPDNIELKKHSIFTTQCIHAFDRSTCSVDLEKSEKYNRVLRGSSP